MDHVRADFGFGLCFQQELEKSRVGDDPEIAVITRHRTSSEKLKTLINTNNLQGQAGRWRQNRSPMAATHCQAEQPRVVAG
jgi:hypothetical protein